jgi:acyl-CoA synthetase (AMP-forming)/AMP-acid ligase II
MRSPFLPDWLEEHAARAPEAPAIAAPGSSLTYAALLERVEAVAARLAAEAVSAGDRVLVALPNTPAAVVASLALQRLGATPVEVNREWSPEVLAGIVRRAGCRRAFVWGADARGWRDVAARAPLDHLWVVHAGRPAGPLAAALSDVASEMVQPDGSPDRSLPRAALPRPELRADHPAVVLYTSGSTGEPRGVVLTHANVDANTRSIVEYLRLTAEDRALLVLPLSYCYGRSVLQTHLQVGGSVFLDSRFAFPRVVLEALASERCTGFAGVPLTFEILRRQVDVSSMRFPALRYLTQAGGAMTPATTAWVREAFRPARLFVMYGQTEATARLSYLPPERAAEKPASMGIPIPGVTLAIVDDAGRPLPDGEVGQLVARGANVTPGYLDDPEATTAILRDGWLWTGDLARRDADGFFFHEGRAKDILKIGGHRVSPIEIEQVVERCPGVLEAAVVGAPDPLRGDVPVAFLVMAPGAVLEEDALRRYCRERMPGYRVPATFRVVKALPRNGAGKLLRAEVAAQLLGGSAARRGATS